MHSPWQYAKVEHILQPHLKTAVEADAAVVKLGGNGIFQLRGRREAKLQQHLHAKYIISLWTGQNERIGALLVNQDPVSLQAAD